MDISYICVFVYMHCCYFLESCFSLSLYIIKIGSWRCIHLILSQFTSFPLQILNEINLIKNPIFSVYTIKLPLKVSFTGEYSFSKFHGLSSQGLWGEERSWNSWLKIMDSIIHVLRRMFGRTLHFFYTRHCIQGMRVFRTL